MRAAQVALTLAVLTFLPVGPPQALAENDLSDFAFQPHPGAHLPLVLDFVDEQGRSVPLGHFFAGQPVVLVLDYLRCKTLCGLTLENVVAGLGALPFDAGRDYQVVAISIDSRDTPADAAAAKAKYLAGHQPGGGHDGWHFLTGAQPALQRVAAVVGFPYRYDAELDQYVHPAGFVLAAPDGTISRYLLDINAAPSELQNGLADAGRGGALDSVTRFLLLCHTEGPPLGRYTVPIEAAFAFANLAGFAALVTVFVAIRRRRQS